MAPPQLPAAGPAADAQQADANATHLKLPTFVALDAATWFLRAEISFRLHRTPESRKTDHVLASLPEEIFVKISRFLRDNPDVTYADLKAFLLGRFTDSAAHRAAKIRSLSTQPLGDEDPLDAWNEIQTLASLHPPVDIL